MGANGCEELPQDLERGRRGFRAWRGRRKVGDRIPQSLWAMAVRLANTYGVSPVASVLGLDYYSLQQRTEAAAEPSPSSGPAFVELPSPVVVGQQCLVEWDNGTGTTMRVHLTGYAADDVTSLLRGLWNIE